LLFLDLWLLRSSIATSEIVSERRFFHCSSLFGKLLSPVSRYPWKAVIPILLGILLYSSWKSYVSLGKLLFSIIVLFSSYSFVPLEGDTLKLSLMLSQENWYSSGKLSFPRIFVLPLGKLFSPRIAVFPPGKLFFSSLIAVAPPGKLFFPRIAVVPPWKLFFPPRKLFSPWEAVFASGIAVFPPGELFFSPRIAVVPPGKLFFLRIAVVPPGKSARFPIS
jgi:hypothetical protein